LRFSRQVLPIAIGKTALLPKASLWGTPLFTFLEVFKTGAPDSYRENRSTAKGIPLGHSSVYFLEVFKTGAPDGYRENRSTAKGIPLGHSSVYFLEVFKTGTPDSYR
jgi:hypothetical protein